MGVIFSYLKISPNGPEIDEIHFNSLPYSIKTSIIKKFNYQQMINFEECCFNTFELCETFSKLKFPHSDQTILLRNNTIYRWDNKNMFKYVSLISEVPQVQLEIEKFYLDDAVSNKNLDFLSSHVKKCNVLTIPPNLILENPEILKIVEPNHLVFDPRYLQSELPTDYGNVETILFANATYISSRKAFSMRCKQQISFYKIFMSEFELFQQVQLWREGKWKCAQRFHFAYVRGFIPGNFLIIMKSFHFTEKKHAFGEKAHIWNVKKISDANIYLTIWLFGSTFVMGEDIDFSQGNVAFYNVM